MKLNKLFLTVGILLTLTACNSNPPKENKVTHVLGNYCTGPNGLSLVSNAIIDHTYTFDMDAMKAAYDELNAAIEEQDVEKVKAKLEITEGYASELVDTMTFARTRYYASSKSIYKQIYITLMNQYYEYFDIDDVALFKAVDTNNQEIIDIMFATFSEEEKAGYIEGTNAPVELYEEIQELQMEANDLYNNKDDNENYENDIIDLFYELAPLQDEFAKAKGFDNYLDYAYKVSYGRNYTKEDANNFTTKVKEIISPAFKKATFSNLSEEEIKRLNDIEKLSFAHENVQFGKYLDEYADFMGGSYRDNYEHAFTDGYFLFSDSEYSQGTAFTANLNTSNEPMLYFSKNYQCSSTIVHEFGHYNAFLTNQKNRGRSFDINETFSRGNEALFANFVASKYNTDFLKAYKETAIDKISNNLFKTSFATDVENYLFANYDKVSKETALEAIHEIYSHYPMEEGVTYWGYPVLCDTGYYISYGTSALQALQLGEQCNNDLNVAKSNYFKLVNNTENLSDVELWANSGLASPFEESTMREVAKIFSNR